MDLQGTLVDAAGNNVGLRLSLSENEGRSTSANIRLPHDVRSASRVGLNGSSRGHITNDQDKITVAMRSSERTFVDVLWKSSPP